MLLVSLSAYSDYQSNRLPAGNEIVRNQYGEGAKEIQLKVKKEEGEWQDISVTIGEKEYIEEELEELYKSFIPVIQTIVLGKNDNSEAVCEDLDFIQEAEGFPFFITWKSGDVSVIDGSGKIVTEEREKEVPIEIIMTASYKEWSKEHVFSFIVAPIEKDGLWDLKLLIGEEEERNRVNRAFILPDNYKGESLNWRLKGSRTSLIIGGVFIGILPLLYCRMDRELHKEAVKRKEEIEAEYPEFIGVFVLYLEAGLSMQSSLFRISQDYMNRRNSNGRKNYLYEEINNMCRQMKNGMPEKEAYEYLGRRCDLSCYRKLVSIMVRFLERGNAGMMDNMRQEIENANEAGYKRVKKKGEEISTKLLIPMMMMLSIVMILIMVPACFSFQI